MPNLQSPVPAAQGKIQPQTHQRTHSLTPESPRTVSTLKTVWAETQFADEASGGTTQNKIEAPAPLPAAAALATSNSQSTANEGTSPPRPARTHQRSLSQLLPSWSTRQTLQAPNGSADNSPTKEDLPFEYMASLTGDKGGRARVPTRKSGWFGGSSASEVIGSEHDELDSKKASAREPSPNRKLERRGTLPVLDSNSTPAKSTGVFGFLSSSKAHAQPIQLPSDLDNDEYINLDIQSSLFPSGQIDTFSPAAFKNLRVNAEGVIQKLQNVYKLRTIQYNEIRAEKDAQEEELEEAQTRAKFLKLQLEDMVKKFNEQDNTIEELVNQLAEEKLARVEERDQFNAQIKRREEEARISQHRTSCCSTAGEEDLGIPPDIRAKWRKSAGSADLSGESDDDMASGGGESVFSRSRSPTLTVSTVMTTKESTRDSTPDVPSSFGRVGALQKDAQINNNPTIVVPAKPKPQTSAFKKMLGIGSGESSPTNGCANCNGQGTSMAWDTVGLLRAENKTLKDRVNLMEGEIEGALDICGGLFPVGSGL
ncbi:uncharacterized protein EAF01_007418 [Botrytis porri]|uniref:Uncharacterized protein n=1 Tax=Botrytis porri TaxID=87229 RepID=A0A4Z1KBJ6_9HELO|nr:uncharacterized protein EAF01_007418 [Botrytis porri]KAF7902120.1 hypothetical protein EAF01_007418 [Botrytis porri]TGO82738.1 hypothetical protein BPOR_0768g00020 [Botrytis porri]